MGDVAVDERRLGIFRTVAEQRSFSRAASLLYISQPTVSQQIQALEEHFGARLFDRNSKSVVLTAAGRALFERTEQLLREFTATRRAVLRAVGDITGVLTLGASQTNGEYILPSVLAAFRGDHPDVMVRLQIQNTERIEALLLAGRLDLALLEGPVTLAELTQVVFLVDELVVIAPGGHPWREKAVLSLADIQSERWIVREAGSGTRRVMEEALARAGIAWDQLNIVTEMEGMEAIKGAVEAGMGVSCLSRWAIRKELSLGALICRPVRGLPMQRTLRAVYPTGHTLVPAAAALLRQLKSPELLQILG